MAGRENKKRFVGLNTALLLILGVVSGVLTVWGVSQIKTAMRAGVDVDNVPAGSAKGRKKRKRKM